MARSNENRSNKTVKTTLNDKTNAFKTRILVIQSFYAFLGALFGKTKMVLDSTEDLGIMKEHEQKWKETNVSLLVLGVLGQAPTEAWKKDLDLESAEKF